MSESTPPPVPPPSPMGPGDVRPAPLTTDDPPRIGDFWLDARLIAGPSGVGYLAHDADDSPAMLLLLSDGAARDAAARGRLAGEVNKLHIDTVIARGGEGQDDGRLAMKFRSEHDDPVGPDQAPLAPWVALAFDGSPAAVAEAERLLRQVDLSRLGPLGAPSGPGYELHWLSNTRPGTNRLWPLPWPGRLDRAGWVTIAVSWLLTLLLAAVALLIVVLIFQNSPPQPPPPPVPTSASGSGSPSSASPSSGSPSSGSPSSGSPSSGSPSSGSPSQSSGSPSPSGSSGTPSQSSAGTQSPTRSASMESPDPSGSASGGGSPTPNRRL